MRQAESVLHRIQTYYHCKTQRLRAIMQPEMIKAQFYCSSCTAVLPVAQTVATSDMQLGSSCVVITYSSVIILLEAGILLCTTTVLLCHLDACRGQAPRPVDLLPLNTYQINTTAEGK